MVDKNLKVPVILKFVTARLSAITVMRVLVV